MQIQVNTGPGIDGKATLEQWASEHLQQQLARFKGQVTRVDVHLSDENGGRTTADDKRCTMSARLAGAADIAVREDAATIDVAVRGALSKLVRTLGSQLERQNDHRDRSSIRTVAEDSV